MSNNTISQSYLITNHRTSSTLSSTVAPGPKDLGAFFQLSCPIGCIIMYAGGSLPANYLWCNGASYNQITYASLYQVIGTTYGSLDTATSFLVPNLTKAVPIGASNTANRTISYANTTTTSGGNTYMTVNQIASHSHGPPQDSANGVYGYSYVYWYNGDPGQNVQTGDNGINVAMSNNVDGGYIYSNTANAGSGAEFLPPFTVVNFIIKYC